MARFGRRTAKPFDELNEAVRKIFLSARMLSHHWLDQGRREWRTEEDFQKHLSEMHKHEALFWETGTDRDPINTQVELAIGEMEALCRAIIDPKPRLGERIKMRAKRLFQLGRS
jgi:hypothetical protein